MLLTSAHKLTQSELMFSVKLVLIVAALNGELGHIAAQLKTGIQARIYTGFSLVGVKVYYEKYFKSV